MAPVTDAGGEVGEEAPRAVEEKGHLRDEHVVGVGLGERRVAGDEARVATH